MGATAKIFALTLLVLATFHTHATLLARIQRASCDDASSGNSEDLGNVHTITPSLYAIEVGVSEPKYLYLFTIAARNGVAKVYGLFNSRDDASEALELLQSARQLSADNVCVNRLLVDGKPVDGIDERVTAEEHPWKTVRNCDVNPKTLAPICDGA